MIYAAGTEADTPLYIADHSYARAPGLRMLGLFLRIPIAGVVALVR